MEFTTTCVDRVVIHPYLEGIYSMVRKKGRNLIAVIHPYLEGICSHPTPPLPGLIVVIHPYLEGIRIYIKQKPLIKILWKKHY